MNKDQLKARIEAVKCKVKEFTCRMLNDKDMEPAGITLKRKCLASLAIGFYLTAWTGVAEASIGPLAGKDMQQYTGTTFSYDFGGLPIVNGGFIKLNITTVPLPGAIWLFGSGLLALMGFKRRGNIG